MKLELCHKIDNEFWEHYPFWKVILSNGEEVYQSTPYQGASWQLLKDYIEDNELSIKEFSIHFRTNVIQLDVYGQAVSFSHAIKANLGGDCRECFVVGCLKGNSYHMRRFLVPEMIEYRAETKIIESYKGLTNLIWNDTPS